MPSNIAFSFLLRTTYPFLDRSRIADMPMKLYIDFEYNESQNRDMGLVSCAVNDEDFWMDAQGFSDCRDYLLSHKGATVICFNADAEARCFIALGIDPLDYEWIDLFLDYRQLMNNDIRYEYGRYIGTTVLGKPVVKKSIGWKNRNRGQYMEEEERKKWMAVHKARAAQAGMTAEPINPSLMNAVLNFTGISDAKALKDYEQKIDTRDLIIKNRSFSLGQARQILRYGRDDIRELKTLEQKMGEELCRAGKYSWDDMVKYRKFRGKVGAMMAIVSSNGTPIDMESLENLTRNALAIENHAKQELNLRTGLPLCQWDVKGVRDNSFRLENFKKDKGAMCNWISSQKTLRDSWPKGKDGKYSLKNEVIEDFKGNDVVTEYRRMLKTCNAMKYSKPDDTGMSEVQKVIGSDNRLRCTLFPYGTQTGRNAAKAKQYIYAQGAWLKAAVIDIPEGYAIVETDYSSQEFLIGGILSQDQKMIEAYKTDVYISFAKAAGLYPDDCKDLTVMEIKSLGHERQDLADIRQKIKGVVLGMSYGAGAPKISATTGIPVEEVARLINKYRNTYARYYQWREKVWRDHLTKGIRNKTSGWYLGRDNDSKLSTQNFPVQHEGAVLLHVALEKLLRSGIHVINTLHDAVYYLVKLEELDETIDIVESLMLQASEEVLGQKGMKIESEVWRHGERIITAKGKKDWDRYKKFIDKDEIIS